jgi:outer membrane lipoprotein-sorting protein
MMSRFFPACVLVLVQAAAVSVPAVNADGLTRAFGFYRGKSVEILMSGSQRTGREESTIRTNLYFNPAEGRSKPKLEFTDYHLDRLRIRIVADGTNLWFYDRDRNEYAMTEYKDEKELSVLARSLTSGQSLYAIRTLSEISSGSPFKSWLPLSQITTSRDNANAAIMRSTTSWLSVECGYTENDEIYASQIDFEEREGSYFSQWRIRVNLFLPTTEMYKFTIPRGAKPVSFPVSKRTGS